MRRQFLKLSAGTFAAAAIVDQALALQSILTMGNVLGDLADRSKRNKGIEERGRPMETENLERFLERTPRKKKAPGLKGVRGRIRFETEDGGAAYLLQIEDEDVELTTGGDDAQAVVVCDTKALIARLLRGEANLIVQTLQGHTSARGDLTLVIKAVLGLQAGSPFAGGEQIPKEAPL
jgi:SCP-2 sterol transfer family